MHSGLRRILLAVVGLSLPACGPELPDQGLDVPLHSAAGVMSHEAGMNCLQCHQAQGPGDGRFTVAGSARDSEGSPLAGAMLRITTEPGGTGDVLLELTADDSGSFYTTAPAPMPEQTVWYTLVAASGTSKSMPFPTQSGACNMCHVGRQALILD